MVSRRDVVKGAAIVGGAALLGQVASKRKSNDKDLIDREPVKDKTKSEKKSKSK